MAPKHEHPLVLVEHDGHSCPRHANDVVLEALAAGELDVRERQFDPTALVERTLSVHPPSHSFLVDHRAIMAHRRLAD
jgi:hypothetical protein